MKTKRKITLSFTLLLFAMISMILNGCTSIESSNQSGKKDTIIFADAGWDSIRLHNEIAGFIIENGYGYNTDVIPGSTAATFAGFRNGDIDVYMEVWTDNLVDVYEEAIDSGDILEVSTNFDDNAQGLYVPTVIIEGDKEKGIEPIAPDLKHIKDLDKYWEIFKDPEGPTKGRIYGSPPGWSVDEIMREKVNTYGLNDKFNYFSPGSDSALSASLAGAAEKGEPWVGYYWEPTWVLGKYDMTLLQEDPYDEEKWNNGYGSSFPPMPVTVCVYKEMEKEAPDVVGFLKNYKTSSAITSEALAYMQETDSDTKQAAQWFLKEYEDIWSTWVSEDIANKVKSALN